MEDNNIKTKKYMEKKKKNLSAYVSWIGKKDVIRPSVEIQLLQNGKYYGEEVLLRNGSICHTWEDLDIVDEFGDDYVYSVIQLTKLENYDTEISRYGLLIVNRYKSK